MDKDQHGVLFLNDNYFFDLTLTDFHMHRQKLGIIIENKMVQKLKDNIVIIYSSTKNRFCKTFLMS